MGPQMKLWAPRQTQMHYGLRLGLRSARTRARRPKPGRRLALSREQKDHLGSRGGPAERSERRPEVLQEVWGLEWS